MSTALPRSLLRIKYYEAAQAYLRALPPEHFMEATAQATQRKITLESLDLVSARRSEVQVFNELLVQYPLRGDKIGQVVPDNMVVVHSEPIVADGSYDVPVQPVGPFWMMEYVSNSNKRKDYEKSFKKYERDLKVPYYLLFYPDGQELTLYHLEDKKFVSVKPNESGRYAIPELDLELTMEEGWVRYWYKGDLLLLPADLQRDLDEARRQLAEANHRAEEQMHRANEEHTARLAAEQELAVLRTQIAELRSRTGKHP